jgi:hypothetical protein
LKGIESLKVINLKTAKAPGLTVPSSLPAGDVRQSHLIKTAWLGHPAPCGISRRAFQGFGWFERRGLAAMLLRNLDPRIVFEHPLVCDLENRSTIDHDANPHRRRSSAKRALRRTPASLSMHLALEDLAGIEVKSDPHRSSSRLGRCRAISTRLKRASLDFGHPFIPT